MVKVCCVCDVEQTAINSHLNFHRFPINLDSQKQWLIALVKENTQNTKNLIVCGKHFKPEDYRKYCDKPLLKHDAIPWINLPDELDAHVELPENDETNLENSTTEMEYHEEIKENNVERVENSMSIDINKNLKRTSDSSCNTSSKIKKRCYIKDIGIFRREDFVEQSTWNRFVEACEDFRKKNEMLQCKNKQLLTKIETFNDVIQELKGKDLLTNSVEEMLNVC